MHTTATAWFLLYSIPRLRGLTRCKFMLIMTMKAMLMFPSRNMVRTLPSIFLMSGACSTKRDSIVVGFNVEKAIAHDSASCTRGRLQTAQ